MKLEKLKKELNYQQIKLINKNLYIFGIARTEDEKQTVLDEADQVQDVEEVISSIFLKKDLSNNKRLSDQQSITSAE